MTEFVVRNRLSNKKVNAILGSLRAWGIDVDVKTPARKKKPRVKLQSNADPLAEVYGMWADRDDFDLDAMRREAYERRTKYYDRRGTV
jgi:hypothetical protein